MDCEKASERLNAYLDGELSADEAAMVREHLPACARCAAQLDELERLNSALGALGAMTSPPGFAHRVRVAGERPREPVRLFSFPAGALNRALTGVAALLMTAAGLWFGLMAGHSVSRTQAPVPETEVAEFELAADLLSAAPSGSLADVYLTFAPEDEWGGPENGQ